MSRYAFISYSTEDLQRAHAICEQLEERGVSCWIAPKSITPGTRFDEAILDAIDGCSAFVFLLSSNASKSPFVLSELNRAFSNRKDIFTVRVEDVQPEKAVQMYTSRHQWVDAIQLPLEASCARLASAILGLEEAKQPDIVAPPPVSSQLVATRSDASYDDILQQLVKEHGYPQFDIELACTTYLIYGDKLFKIVNRHESKPKVYVFRKLPSDGSRSLAESTLPLIEGWRQPQGMIRIALLARKPKAGMRLEDVVLFAGVPKKWSHGSPPIYSESWWSFSDWEEKEITTNQFRKSANDIVIGS